MLTAIIYFCIRIADINSPLNASSLPALGQAQPVSGEEVGTKGARNETGLHLYGLRRYLAKADHLKIVPLTVRQASEDLQARAA